MRAARQCSLPVTINQCEAGERLGAVINSAGEYDMVIDCGGTKSSLDKCLEHARPGAKVVLLGVYWDGFELDAFKASMKEVEVYFSAAYNHHGAVRDLDMAANLLGHWPKLPELLITHRFPLEAAEEAFATAAARGKGAIKVVFEP